MIILFLFLPSFYGFDHFGNSLCRREICVTVCCLPEQSAGHCSKWEEIFPLFFWNFSEIFPPGKIPKLVVNYCGQMIFICP